MSANGWMLFLSSLGVALCLVAVLLSLPRGPHPLTTQRTFVLLAFVALAAACYVVVWHAAAHLFVPR